MKKLTIKINLFIISVIGLFIGFTSNLLASDQDNQSNHDHKNIAIISQDVANNAQIKTDYATSQIISETVPVAGKVILNPDMTSDIKARFPGIVKNVGVQIGQKVKKGQILATIESNDSLRLYSVKSPIDGIILNRNIAIGNLTKDEVIFTIADISKLWAKFHIFAKDIKKIKEGQEVVIRNLENNIQENSKISFTIPIANSATQTISAIAELNNKNLQWQPEIFIQGDIKITEKEVAIAIESQAIQRVGDEIVVFVKTENEKYEAKPVKLGLANDRYIEIIQGLENSDEYVTQGSFLIKSDILKSQANH